MSARNDVVQFAMETQQNPYLLGKYAAIQDELTIDDLEIEGEIPADLHGVYVRNGPNPRFAPKGRYHWFDGDGMLHAVHIRDGKVTYRNRWIQTDGLQRDTKAGHALWSGYMDPIHENPRDMPLKDTANTDIVLFRKRLMALWYLSGRPYSVNPLTLETEGVEDFNGQLSQKMSAHAKVDEATGELMFFNFDLRPPFMTYGVVSADGTQVHTTPIELPGPRIPHDLAFTPTYTILMDLPLFPSMEGLKRGQYRPHFHREIPTRFGLIPRHGQGDQIRWFDAEPCYIYHTINAWEEGDEVVLVGCRTPEPEPPSDVRGALERMLAFLQLNASLHEWRFNLKTGAVRERPLDDRNTEFPSLHTACLGQKNRYSYNVSVAPEKTLLFDGIMKYDIQTGQGQHHVFGPGRYGSESPFAPRANATHEDDGYLLSFVYDAPNDRSELVILDASDLSQAPLATVRIPRRVPIGFHACWVPGDQLDEMESRHV